MIGQQERPKNRPGDGRKKRFPLQSESIRIALHRMRVPLWR